MSTLSLGNSLDCREERREGGDEGGRKEGRGREEEKGKKNIIIVSDGISGLFMRNIATDLSISFFFAWETWP